MCETWKAVVGFESRYEVSNHGRVRARERREVKRFFQGPTKVYFPAKIRKLYTNKDGYLRVDLTHLG